jgi:hypothetical protein
MTILEGDVNKLPLQLGEIVVPNVESQHIWLSIFWAQVCEPSFRLGFLRH